MCRTRNKVREKARNKIDFEKEFMSLVPESEDIPHGPFGIFELIRNIDDDGMERLHFYEEKANVITILANHFLGSQSSKKELTSLKSTAK